MVGPEAMPNPVDACRPGFPISACNEKYLTHKFEVMTMRYLSLESQKDGTLLFARVLLMVLFVLFGYN